MANVHLRQPDQAIRSTGRLRSGRGPSSWVDCYWGRRLDAIPSAVQATHRAWHERTNWPPGKHGCAQYDCPFVGWLVDHVQC